MGSLTFDRLLEKTNCEHVAHLRGGDPAALQRIVNEAAGFPPEALQARFHGGAPDREYIENTLMRAEYVSAIRSRTQERLVGIGEIYPMADGEYEITFMWRDDFTTSAGLAHFLRKGLICHNLRHLFDVAANELGAQSIVAIISSMNEKALAIVEDNGFYRSESYDDGELLYRRAVTDLGPTSKCHEIWLRNFFID